MNLTVLSRSPAIYTTRRLLEAGSARGHNARALDPLRCEMHLDGKRAHLFYERAEMPPCDVVVPRIASSIAAYGLSVLNGFELRGTPVVNGSAGIATARNKMRCLQMLAAHGIPIPSTVMASTASDLKAMVELVGGVPVLVKVLQGGERTGVMVCQSLQSMESTLEALLGLGHDLVIQQYALDRRGRDIRTLVVGGEVVASARRRPKVDKLSRSLARGARLEKVQLGADFQRMAVEAARLVGLEVAAVDMLDLKDGPRIFEVNASPGLKDLEQATGQDLATEVVALAERVATSVTRLPTVRSHAPSPPPNGVGRRRNPGRVTRK